MRRVILVCVGALTFLGTHLVEAANWQAWFGGTHEPWFLNSAPAVALTAGCLFLAGAVLGAVGGDGPDIMRALAEGGFMGAGAMIALALVLFRIGPGTIFPIVIAAGAFIVTVSSTAGLCTAWAVRLSLSRSHPRP
jgi:hypothetical protein